MPRHYGASTWIGERKCPENHIPPNSPRNSAATAADTTPVELVPTVPDLSRLAPVLLEEALDAEAGTVFTDGLAAGVLETFANVLEDPDDVCEPRVLVALVAVVEVLASGSSDTTESESGIFAVHSDVSRT